MDARIVKRGETYIVPSRGLIVVDRRLEKLGHEIRRLNIMVIKSGKISDTCLKQTILPGRIFITSRPGKFQSEACCYEYGIIAIDRILPAKFPALAKKISDEIIRWKLWNRQYGWIVRLKRGGQSTFEELIG